MTECPFLSTYDSIIECFKECALYNCKSTDGVCPFQNLAQYGLERIRYKEEPGYVKKDLSFIKDSYAEMHNQYL